MDKYNKILNLKLPTFLKGFASAFDITGQGFLSIPDLNTGFQRDAEALRRDWIVTGLDFKNAIKRFNNEQKA